MRNKGHSVSGAALLVVIFVIMLFGMLGWTLAVMQSGSFESASRGAQSGRALYIAEAGAQWGLSSRASGDEATSPDDTCSRQSDWLTHNITGGQYQVCTRNPSANETGSIVVESIGYVPSVAAYRSKRKVKIAASVGSFSKSVLAGNLFNWTSTDKTNSYVRGDMLAMYYEANGNNVYNEYGMDYSDNVNSLLPKTNKNTPVRRDVGGGILPEIDMAFYENDYNATILAPVMTGVIANVSIVDSGTRTQVRMASSNFFGSNSSAWAVWVGQVLRNISLGAWKPGRWKDIQRVVNGTTAVLNGIVDWKNGDRLTMIPKISADPSFNTSSKRYTMVVNGTFSWPVDQAVRNFSKGTWNYSDWGVIYSISSANNKTTVVVQMDSSVNSKTWQAGDWVGFVRRFTWDDTWWGGLLNYKYLLYVESDTLFDVRSDDIDAYRTGVVSEGDVVIRGTELIHLEKKPLSYPNIATKFGNVYSPDTPRGNNLNQRLGKRNFDDVIFTQYGDVNFNYVDCMAMYGVNITLSGVFRMNYDPQLTRLSGYAFGVSSYEWTEE